MAARLINRLNSDTCVNCSHSAAQFGPYLDTGIVIPGATKLVPVVYCAGCATQIMQPLDVVPRTALRTARDEVRREQEFSADVSQQLEGKRELAHEVESLKAQLENVRSERDYLLLEKQERATAPARERREQLLARVQAPATSTRARAKKTQKEAA